MEYEMGVQLADDGLDKRRKKSEIKSKAIKFTKIVSLVGLRHATDSRNSTTRRFIWVAWVVLGIGLAVFQIQDRLGLYYKYPSSTNIQIITIKKLRFPQVTICSDNQILAKNARKRGHFITIANVENTMQRLRVYEERNYEPHLKVQTKILLKEYIEKLHSDTQNWLNLSKELAPTADEAVLTVSFNGEKNKSIMEEVITDLGHCFAFGTNKSPLYTTKPGPLNGLNLILSAPRLQIIPCVRYLSNSKSFPGFRMLIHDPDEVPRMRHSGFTLKPGMTTRVTVELENVTLQGEPYGNCFDEDMTYKASHCLAECDDKAFIERCGCKDIYMTINATDCSYGNILNCTYAFESSVNVSSGECDCKHQCHRRVYKPSITESTSPQVLSEEVKRASPELQVEDIIQAVIYYPQLSYFEAESVPGYTPFKLLCDVGNALSLLLGATLLTIYEASEFLIVFLGDYFRFRFVK